MTYNHYNSSFELIETTRIKKYQTLNSAIEKANFISINKKGTYTIQCGGHLAELKTYTIVDKETGYCLNNNNTLTYSECIQLIQMYC